MLLILGIISLAGSALGLLWFTRARHKRAQNPTEQADLNRAGSLIFTFVSLVVGAVSFFLYFTGYPDSASQLDGASLPTTLPLVLRLGA